MNIFSRPKKSLYLLYLLCLAFCAGKSTRASSGVESQLMQAQANAATFPEGADKSLPQVKKFQNADLTLYAWSQDFARGHALLLELETDNRLNDLQLVVNDKKLPLSNGQGCRYAFYANAPNSTRRENIVRVLRGANVAAEFKLPVVLKAYPVARSKLNVQNFSNKSKPMTKETVKFIEEGVKKKQKAFVSANESYLGQEMRYPRDAHKITSPFFIKRIYERFKVVKGRKKSLPGKTSYHGGTDLKAPVGAPIFAIADGVVNLAELLYYEGNIVMIDHGNGVISGYMHQSELIAKQGERVKAGQQIGKAGATGMVTGPHLHIFMLIHGVKIDPLSFIVLPVRPAR